MYINVKIGQLYWSMTHPCGHVGLHGVGVHLHLHRGDGGGGHEAGGVRGHRGRHH